MSYLISTSCSDEWLNNPKFHIKTLVEDFFFLLLSIRSTVRRELLDEERESEPDRWYCVL